MTARCATRWTLSVAMCLCLGGMTHSPATAQTTPAEARPAPTGEKNLRVVPGRTTSKGKPAINREKLNQEIAKIKELEDQMRELGKQARLKLDAGDKEGADRIRKEAHGIAKQLRERKERIREVRSNVRGDRPAPRDAKRQQALDARNPNGKRSPTVRERVRSRRINTQRPLIPKGHPNQAELKAEWRLHAQHLAKIRRLIEVGRASGDTELLGRLGLLRKAEQVRHTHMIQKFETIKKEN